MYSTLHYVFPVMALKYGVYIICILGFFKSLFHSYFNGDKMRRTSVKINIYTYNKLKEKSKKKFYNVIDDFLAKYNYDEEKILREIKPYLKGEIPSFAKTVPIFLPGLYLWFLKALAARARTSLSDVINAMLGRINRDIEYEEYVREKKQL